MQYVIRTNRPLVDDEMMDLVVASKAEAAEALVFLMEMEILLVPDFEVISQESSETELKIILSTGMLWAFPLGAH